MDTEAFFSYINDISTCRNPPMDKKSFQEQQKHAVQHSNSKYNAVGISFGDLNNRRKMAMPSCLCKLNDRSITHQIKDAGMSIVCVQIILLALISPKVSCICR